MYAEEMIDVDAHSGQTEPGERVVILLDFSLRLTALAMERTARQLEDDGLDMS